MSYSNSPLVTYTNISPNKTSPRNNSIDRITIHCIVGQWTAKQACDFFKSSSVQASCNYAVGKDGSIGLCVEEKDRSWCSSSGANDHRAITIETASDTYSPYAVTDEAFSALLDLCEDICRRNDKTKLIWFGDKATTLAYSPAYNEMVMTVHQWFANKDCPGAYLLSRHAEIAQEVTRRLDSATGGEGGDSGGGTVTPPANPNVPIDYATYIWNYFINKIGNEYGVAALMGNLYAESSLYPDRVQGDIPYSQYSQDYTASVDNGSITEYDFVHNGPNGGGYGLAQWTYYTRKQALYNMYVNGNYSSIGSIELACDYLYYELQNDFPSVLTTLETATNIRTASNAVLHDFENPADQSASVEAKRAEYAQYYYNLFADGAGGDDPTTGGNASMYYEPMSKLLLLAVALDDL